jgi:hypothetical protein
MGCDIHTLAQRRTSEGWEDLDYEPFQWRSYDLFGFLADVRNYSATPPITAPRGLPADFADPEDRFECLHATSWLTTDELLSFNYDQTFEDRRVTVQEGPNHWNGGATCASGDGRTVTFREFLGNSFFEDLAKLSGLGAQRIVFGFDG